MLQTPASPNVVNIPRFKYRSMRRRVNLSRRSFRDFPGDLSDIAEYSQESRVAATDYSREDSSTEGSNNSQSSSEGPEQSDSRGTPSSSRSEIFTITGGEFDGYFYRDEEVNNKRSKSRKLLKLVLKVCHSMMKKQDKSISRSKSQTIDARSDQRTRNKRRPLSDVFLYRL